MLCLNWVLTNNLTTNILRLRHQIDTKGFQNVLKLVKTTHADSFDLFYGLYKFNRNSMEIIKDLKKAMDDVVGKLLEKEEEEQLNSVHENFGSALKTTRKLK